MPRVLVTIEYVIDIERAGDSFGITDFTDKEFKTILSIIESKRKFPVAKDKDGYPNPEYTVQMLDSEEDLEWIEEERVKAKAAKSTENLSVAKKRYLEFLKSG